MSITLAVILVLFSSCDTTESNVTSLSLNFASEPALQKVNADDFQIQEVTFLTNTLYDLIYK